MKSSKARITTDPALARYDDVSLFPEKVVKAKEMLAKTNLQKIQEVVTQPAK